jgi:uncharacterized protein YbaR (Trm112 family)
MFIELVDALRCPRPHEESWLVLASTDIEARHIRHGTLGCPICRAEYPIRDGVADLRLTAVSPRESASPSTALGTAAKTATGSGFAGAPSGAPNVADQVDAEQLAALLDLGDALGFAILVGDWGRHARALLALEQCPPLVLIDPPDGIAMMPGLSGVRAERELPIAVGAARAVATDDVDGDRLASAARTTRAGGRVVAPARASVPDGVKELARDDNVWVGEREAPPAPLVRLHVRRA